MYGSLNADSNTLFTHYTMPDSANNYFQVDFTPNFYTLGDYSPAEVTLCTRPEESDPDHKCLYEAKETGDNDWATATLSAIASLPAEAERLG